MDWLDRGSRVGRPVESVGARVGALVSGADRAGSAGVFASHTYANLSKEARVLLLCTPAGFERYFDRLAAEYAGLEPPEPSGPIPEARVVGHMYPRWRNRYGGLKVDDAKGRQARFGHSVRVMQAPTGGETHRNQDYELELRRFEGLRSCAQEIECSPQRRVALGIGQHSTESLTFLVAEDFPRGRFALDHCACNRHRDVGRARLSKPPREFLDLFRGA